MKECSQVEDQGVIQEFLVLLQPACLISEENVPSTADYVPDVSAPLQ